MCEILIFAGTTEGRRLARFCAEKRIKAYVSAATEYGAEGIGKSPFLRVVTGRKDCGETADFIAGNGIKCVLDATHPYAVEATENIRAACAETGVEYIRVSREKSEKYTDGLYFDDIGGVIEYLNSHDGNALITTGGKELGSFRAVRDFQKRCCARVLPSEGIREKCAAAGFDAAKIIAEKGPFSVEENISHLRRANAGFLVTKDSGSAGGFGEKIAAARIYGAKALIIARPEDDGISVDAAERILEEYYAKKN